MRIAMYTKDGMVYRELTPAEMVEAQAAELVEKPAEISAEDKLNLLLASIPVEKPVGVQDTLPIKVGYKWETVYDGNKFAWQLVRDENAIGTADNPIYLTGDETIDNGVPRLNNAFYMLNGTRYVYMDGQFAEF